jgi:hypothetical protein
MNSDFNSGYTLITDEDMQVPDEAHMCTRVFLLFLLERSDRDQIEGARGQRGRDAVLLIGVFQH